MWWPVIGGAVVGVGGLLCPRALGVGYDVIQDLLAGHLAGTGLLALVSIKAIIWAVALGSGTSGGVLAPLLIMGGCLGAGEAQLFHLGDPGLWAAISMAAMMGGTMRSPFTAVIFLLELTHGVAMLPALLIACTASVLVTVLVMKRSILTEKVARKGHHVMREYGVSPLERQFVSDVMERSVSTVPSTMLVSDLVGRLTKLDPVVSPLQAWPVIDAQGKLAGIVTRGDLLDSLSLNPAGDKTVLEAGTDRAVVTFPDELLIEAVARMSRHDVGRLPVVAREDPRRLEGYLGRTGVIAAWTKGLDEETRREHGWLSRRVRHSLRKARARKRRAV